MSDREPQPDDGPDYHEDHQAWERRHLHRQQVLETFAKVEGTLMRLKELGVPESALEQIRAWQKDQVDAVER